jgi:hypothetical protein
MQSVAQTTLLQSDLLTPSLGASVDTTEEDEWEKTSKNFQVPRSIKQPELTWKNLGWWTSSLSSLSSLFTGGGKSKMTRKRQLRLKKGCNTTYHKFKRANMKTTRMRKKFHAHKKIRMTLKNKNK